MVSRYQIYSKESTVLVEKGNILADNHIGILAVGGNITLQEGALITAKNGGIGIYADGKAPVFSGEINVESGGKDKYSMGIYRKGVRKEEGISWNNPQKVNQSGDYTIGVVLDDSDGFIPVAGASVGGANYMVKVVALDNSNLDIKGQIKVLDGKHNIGIYGDNSTIKISTDSDAQEGDIIVSGNKNLDDASLGVYLNGGEYSGKGTITLGNYALGIYGENLTKENALSHVGTSMVIGNGALGIYGSSKTGSMSSLNFSMSEGMKLGAGSIGVYGNNIHSKTEGNISVGSDMAMGIVSEGDGDVNYTGAMDIADRSNSQSIGIYKIDGEGTITTSADTWKVGNYGYGIYLNQNSSGPSEKEATVSNHASMNLGTAGVGIYSNGKNDVKNYGNISVGTTDIVDGTKVRSVGIYLLGGGMGENHGEITVDREYSIGVYGEGVGTSFTNYGTIEVNNGGTGILVKNGAVAINEGNIVLGANKGTEGTDSIGMAAYSGAYIVNTANGTITGNTGIGMYVGKGATYLNEGKITLSNGTYITGPGKVENRGLMTVEAVKTSDDSSDGGPVTISGNGEIKIGDGYTSLGGTLETAGNIVVDGAYVDITTGTPIFKAPSVTGDIKLLPNFALTGNGISYEIKNFIDTALTGEDLEKLTVKTSPLFTNEVTADGSLIIAKVPYADLTVGDRYENLENGLDNILEQSGGNGKDAEILKGMNAYLEGLSDEDFDEEASNMLGELRGDIYSTIQTRMQNIDSAFDSSFTELESSFNKTPDNNKFSVIYRDSDYRDKTAGIDDYDYNIAGLLYMKERDRDKFGNKYGYTLGFSGARFKFKDGGSKENIYSLRAGAHMRRNLSDEYGVSWLSRIDLGYNRHNADRKLNLQKDYEDHGDYNSMSVAFDNKISKALFLDSSRELDIYSDLKLEYGRFFGFKEHSGDDGGLELKIKSNDYTSVQLGVGLSGFQKLYSGKNHTLKLLGDVKYAYDFGDNYSENRAKLVNGGEGYYDLMAPEKVRGEVIGKLGMVLEKENHYGVTFEVEAKDEGSRCGTTLNYSVRFNYKM